MEDEIYNPLIERALANALPESGAAKGTLDNIYNGESGPGDPAPVDKRKKLLQDIYGARISGSTNDFLGYVPDLASYREYGVTYNPYNPQLSDEQRALNQSVGEQLKYAAGHILANTALDIAGNVGSILDFGDYFNSDEEVGNWLTDWTQEQKQNVSEALPIYQTKNSDMGNSAWWIQNGSDLVSSAASFALTGGIIGKGLSSLKWLNTLTKGRSALAISGSAESAAALNEGIVGASKFFSGQNIAAIRKGQSYLNNFSTSVMLNQAESISSATQAFKDTYALAVNRGYDDSTAKELAANAASHLINVNRANIALNLTSSSLFAKTPESVRSAAKQRAIMGLEEPVKKKTAGKVASFIKEHGSILGETAQEAGEELINLHAEKATQRYAEGLISGKPKGFMDGLFDNNPIEILSLLGTKEGRETAFWGGLGGFAQTGATEYGINRIPGKYFGERVAKLDENGKPVYKTGARKWREDTGYEIGEKLTEDITTSDGTEHKAGTVVTEDLVDKYGVELSHKKDEVVKDQTTLQPIVGPTDDIEYVEGGKYFSKHEAGKVREEQSDLAYANSVKQASDLLKSANTAQKQFQSMAAVEAVDSITDPTADENTKDAYYDYLAKYNVSRKGKDPFDSKLVAAEVAKLKTLNQKELGTLRENANRENIHEMTYNALSSGNLDSLKAIFKNFTELTPEQAETQGFDKATYVDDAKKALSIIDNLESIYTEYNAKYDPVKAYELFHNRAKDLALYDELDAIDKDRAKLVNENTRREALAASTIDSVSGYAVSEDINKREVDELSALEEEIRKKNRQIELINTEEVETTPLPDQNPEEVAAVINAERREKEQRKSSIVKDLAELYEKKGQVHKKYQDERVAKGIANRTDIERLVSYNIRQRDISKSINDNDREFVRLRDRQDSEINRKNLERNAKARKEATFVATMRYFIQLQQSGDYVPVFSEKTITPADMASSDIFRRIYEANKAAFDLYLSQDPDTREDDLNKKRKVPSEIIDLVTKEFDNYYKVYLSNMNSLESEQFDEQYSDNVREKVFTQLSDLFRKFTYHEKVKQYVDLGIVGQLKEENNRFSMSLNYEDEVTIEPEEVAYFENLRSPQGKPVYSVEQLGDENSKLYRATLIEPVVIDLTSDNYLQVSVLDRENADIKEAVERELSLVRSRSARARRLERIKLSRLTEVNDGITKASDQLKQFQDHVEPIINRLSNSLRLVENDPSGSNITPIQARALQALRKKLDSVDEKFASLEKSRLRDEAKGLNKQLAIASNQAKKLDSELLATEEELLLLKANKKASISEINNLKNTIVYLRNQPVLNRKQEKELADAERQLVYLNQRVEMDKDSINAMTESINQLHDQILVAKKQQEQLQESIQEIKARISALGSLSNMSVDEIYDRRESLYHLIDELKKFIDDDGIQIESLKTELSNLLRNRRKIESKSAKLNKLIEARDAIIESADSDISMSLSDATLQRSVISAEIASLRKELNTINQATLQINDAVSTLKAKEAELLMLQEAADKTTPELRQTLLDKISLLEAHRSEIIEAIRELRSEVQSYNFPVESGKEVVTTKSGKRITTYTTLAGGKKINNPISLERAAEIFTASEMANIEEVSLKRKVETDGMVNLTFVIKPKDSKKRITVEKNLYGSAEFAPLVTGLRAIRNEIRDVRNMLDNNQYSFDAQQRVPKLQAEVEYWKGVVKSPTTYREESSERAREISRLIVQRENQKQAIESAIPNIARLAKINAQIEAISPSHMTTDELDSAIESMRESIDNINEISSKRQQLLSRTLSSAEKQVMDELDNSFEKLHEFFQTKIDNILRNEPTNLPNISFSDVLNNKINPEALPGSVLSSVMTDLKNTLAELTSSVNSLNEEQNKLNKDLSALKDLAKDASTFQKLKSGLGEAETESVREEVERYTSELEYFSKLKTSMEQSITLVREMTRDMDLLPSQNVKLVYQLYSEDELLDAVNNHVESEDYSVGTDNDERNRFRTFSDQQKLNIAYNLLESGEMILPDMTERVFDLLSKIGWQDNSDLTTFVSELTDLFSKSQDAIEGIERKLTLVESMFFDIDTSPSREMLELDAEIQERLDKIISEQDPEITQTPSGVSGPLLGPPDDDASSEPDNNTEIVDSWRKASQPGKSQSSTLLKTRGEDNPITGAMMWENLHRDTSEGLLPVWTESQMAKDWASSLNAIASSRAKTADGKKLSFNPTGPTQELVRIRFVTADDALIADRTAYAGDITNKTKLNSRGLNIDNQGRIYIESQTVLSAFLSKEYGKGYMTDEVRKDLIERLGKKGVGKPNDDSARLTIAENDELFKYMSTPLGDIGVEVNPGEFKYFAGKGIYIVLTDKDGKPFFFDKSGTASTSESGGNSIALATIPRPKFADNLRFRDSLAAYVSMHMGLDSIMTWDDLAAHVKLEYLRSINSPVLDINSGLAKQIFEEERNKITISIPDMKGNLITFNPWHVEEIPDTFNWKDDIENNTAISPNQKELLQYVKNRLKTEIFSNRRKYRKKILDMAEKGPVFVEDTSRLSVSPGIAVTRPVLRNEKGGFMSRDWAPVLGDPRSVLSSIEDLASYTVHSGKANSGYSGKVSFRLADGSVVNTEKIGLMGATYMLLKDGTIFSPTQRAIKSQEADLIIDSIVVDFLNEDNTIQEDLRELTVVTEDGQLVPINQISENGLGLIRVQNKQTRSVNRLIEWTGSPKSDRSRTRRTLYVGNEPMSGSDKLYVFFGTMGKVPVTDLKKKTSKEYHEFKKFLTTRRHQVINEPSAMANGTYYHPVSVKYDPVSGTKVLTVKQYDTYIDYLLGEGDVLHSDVLSHKESLAAGGNGERTVNRYVVFGSERELKKPETGENTGSGKNPSAKSSSGGPSKGIEFNTADIKVGDIYEIVVDEEHTYVGVDGTSKDGFSAKVYVSYEKESDGNLKMVIESGSVMDVFSNGQFVKTIPIAFKAPTKFAVSNVLSSVVPQAVKDGNGVPLADLLTAEAKLNRVESKPAGVSVILKSIKVHGSKTEVEPDGKAGRDFSSAKTLKDIFDKLGNEAVRELSLKLAPDVEIRHDTNPKIIARASSKANAIVLGGKFAEANDEKAALILLHEAAHIALDRKIDAFTQGNNVKGISSLIESRDEYLTFVLSKMQVPDNIAQLSMQDAFAEVSAAISKVLVSYGKTEDSPSRLIYNLFGESYLNPEVRAKIMAALLEVVSSRTLTADAFFNVLDSNPDKYGKDFGTELRSSVKEFAAAIFDDNTLQKDLDSIKTTSNKSILRYIIDAFKKIFGLNAKEGHLLEKALSAIDEAISTDIETNVTIPVTEPTSTITEVVRDADENQSHIVNGVDIDDPNQLINDDEDDFSSYPPFEDISGRSRAPVIIENKLTNEPDAVAVETLKELFGRYSFDYSENELQFVKRLSRTQTGSVLEDVHEKALKFKRDGTQKALAGLISSLGFDWKQTEASFQDKVNPGEKVIKVLIDQLDESIESGTPVGLIKDTTLGQQLFTISRMTDMKGMLAELKKDSNGMINRINSLDGGFTLSGQAEIAIRNGITYNLYNLAIGSATNATELLKFFDNHENLNELYGKAIDRTITAIQSMRNSLKELLAKATLDTDRTVMHERISEIENMLSALSYKNDKGKYTNKDLFKKFHAASDLRIRGVRVDATLLDDDLIAELTSSTNEEESTGGRNIDDLLDRIQFDTKDTAAPIIKIMMAAIPNGYLQTTDGLPTPKINRDQYGIPVLEDTNKIWNLMLMATSGTPPRWTDISETISRLAISEREKPTGGIYFVDQVVRQLNRLYDATEPTSVALVNEFVQTFSKYQGMHYNLLLGSNGRLISVNENTVKVRSQLRKQWRQGLVTSVVSYNMSHNLGNTSIISEGFVRQLRTKLSSSEDSEKASMEVLGMLGIVANYDDLQSGLKFGVKESVKRMIDKLEEELTNSKVLDSKNVFGAGGILSGYFQRIITSSENSANAIRDVQILNAEGRTVYPFALNDSLTVRAAELSSYAGKRRTALEKAHPEYYTPWSHGSLLRTRIENGDIIQISTISGSKVEGGVGKTFADQSKGDKLVTAMHMVLQKGVFPINQAADRSRTTAVKIGKPDEVIHLVNNKAETIQYMLNHLIAEIRSIRQANRGIGSDISSFPKSSSDFRFFKSILRADVKSELMTFIKSSFSFTSPASLTNLSFYPKIVEDITKYLDTERVKVIDLLDKTGSLIPAFDRDEVYLANNKRSLGPAKIDVRLIEETAEYIQSEDMNEVIDYLAGKYTYNMIVAYIEMSKTFFGDPAFYGSVANFYKRVKMFNSSSKVSVSDPEQNRMLQENNGVYVVSADGTKTRLDTLDFLRGNFTLPKDARLVADAGFRADGKKMDGILRTVTIKDLNVASVFSFDLVDTTTVTDGKIEYKQVYKRDKNGAVTKELLEAPIKAEPSMMRQVFTEDLVRQGLTSSSDITQKVKSLLKPYNSFDEGDAAAFISLDEYRELSLRTGLTWSDAQENAYLRALSGIELSTEEISGFFPPLKTQLTSYLPEYAESRNEDDRLYVPTGFKHCIAPILPQTAAKYPVLNAIAEYMHNNQVGIVQFQSANKFGAVGDNHLFDPKTGRLTTMNWQSQTVPYVDFGIQVNSAPKRKGKTTMSTQMRKIIMVNSHAFGQIREGYDPQVIHEIKQLQTAIVERGLSDLQNVLGVDNLGESLQGEGRGYIKDRKFITSTIIAESMRRGNPFVVTEYLSRLLPGHDESPDKRGAFIEELFGQSSKAENLLFSIVQKRVIRESRPGEPFIQVPSIGFENGLRQTIGNKLSPNTKLKFYRKGVNYLTGKSGLIPAQMIAPLPPDWTDWVLFLGNGSMKDGLTVLNNKLSVLTSKLERIEEKDAKESLNDEESNLLKLTSLVCFRIPNQNLGSTDSLRIVEFLDPAHCTSCAIPPEMVPKVGGDFDFDKNNSLIPAYTFTKTGPEEDAQNIVPTYLDYVQLSEADITSDYNAYKKSVELAALNSSREYQMALTESKYSYQKLRDIKSRNKELHEILYKNATPLVKEILNIIADLEPRLDSINADVVELAERMLVKNYIDLVDAISSDTKLGNKLANVKVLTEFVAAIDEARDAHIENRIRLENILSSAQSFITREDFKRLLAGDNRHNYVSRDRLANQLLSLYSNMLTTEANMASLLAPVDDSIYTSDERGMEGIAWDARFLKDRESPVVKDYIAQKRKLTREFSGDERKSKLKELYQDTMQKYIAYWNTSNETSSNFTSILSPVENIEKSVRFLLGKQLIGAVAVNIANHSSAQMAGFSMATPVIIHGAGRVEDNANLYFDCNWLAQLPDGSETSFSGNPHTLALVKNEVKLGEELQGYKDPISNKVFPLGTHFYPSFAGYTNTGGIPIANLLSATLNGYVDVVKSTHAFDVNGGEAAIGPWMWFERLGASEKWITRLLNQPIIYEYLEAKDKYGSMLNEQAIQYMVLANHSAKFTINASKDGGPRYYVTFINFADWEAMTPDEREVELKILWYNRKPKNLTYAYYLKMYNNHARNHLNSLSKRKTSAYYSFIRNRSPHDSYEKFYAHTAGKGRHKYGADIDSRYIRNLFVSGKLSYENLEDAMLNNLSSDEQDEVSRAVLNMFLEYQRQANLLRFGVSASNYDTRGIGKSSDMLEMKNYLHDKTKRDGFFLGYDNLISSTALSSFRQVAYATSRMFSDLYLIDRSDTDDPIAPILRALRQTVAKIKPSIAEKERVAELVTSNFLDYLLHVDLGTDKHVSTRQVYNNLIRAEGSKYTLNGSRVSLPKFLAEIQTKGVAFQGKIGRKAVSKKLARELSNNIFLKNLIVEGIWGDELPTESEFFDSLVSTHPEIPRLGIWSPVMTPELMNSLAENLQALRSLSPELYGDIVELTIAQGGVNSVFAKLCGSEIVTRMQYQADALLMHERLNDLLENFTNQFFRRNYTETLSREWDVYRMEGVVEEDESAYSDIFDDMTFEPQFDDVFDSYDSGFNDSYSDFDSAESIEDQGPVDDLEVEFGDNGFGQPFRHNVRFNRKGLMEVRVFRRRIREDGFAENFSERVRPIGKGTKWVGYEFVDEQELEDKIFTNNPMTALKPLIWQERTYPNIASALISTVLFFQSDKSNGAILDSVSLSNMPSTMEDIQSFMKKYAVPDTVLEEAMLTTVPAMLLAQANNTTVSSSVTTVNETADTSMLKTYKGRITKPKDENHILVAGTNTEGRHGKGAALVGKKAFGGLQGQPRGLQGQFYGIVTKDLRKSSHPSIPQESIVDEISSMYEFARNNSDKLFSIAYGTGENLNGYTPEEMSTMFAKAAIQSGMPIPSNVEFNEDFAQLVINASKTDVTTKPDVSLPASEYINHSGGAIGADITWDEIGRKYGVTKHKHYYIVGSKSLHGNVPLTREQAMAADAAVMKANQSLNRTYPTKDEFTNNLLRRNFYQVVDSDAIFAISTFVDGNTKSTIVKGGTAWAVQMALDLGKPVYVFDQIINKWFMIDKKVSAIPIELTKAPALTQQFAGIGTRELNDNGRKAIEDAYQATFGSLDPSQRNIVKKMEMAFKDGESGRKMRPEFKGKSTMDLVLSGKRTATSRHPDYVKGIKKGTLIEFYDRQGRKALVRVTSDPYPLSDVTADEWSKLEGWSSMMYDDLSKQGYMQFTYQQETGNVSRDTNVSSTSVGILYALTNPTLTTPRRFSWSASHFDSSPETVRWVNLMRSRRIPFNGSSFIDAEHAYQSLKSGDRAADYELMVNIIVQKFKTFPELYNEVISNGGMEFLQSLTHNTTARNPYWESNGEDTFMRALKEAFMRLKDGRDPNTIIDNFEKNSGNC